MARTNKYPIMDACRDLKHQGLQRMFPDLIYMDKRTHRRLVREINRHRKQSLPSWKRGKRLVELRSIYGMKINIHNLGIPIVFIDEDSRRSYKDENGSN